MIFNEDSRVKIPALLHFTRLGYRYLSFKDAKWDESSNIFPTFFRDSLRQGSGWQVPALLRKSSSSKAPPAPKHLSLNP